MDFRRKFEFYRKWLNSLLINEFFNLPFKEQGKFLILIEKFLEDCKRVNKEALHVSEKIVQVKIKEILSNEKEIITLIGQIRDTDEEVKIEYPKMLPLPQKEEYLTVVLYSLDKKMWYSSKKQLIMGR